MRSFNDNEGRAWSLAVNVAAVKRVRGLVDVDLMDIIGGGLIEKLVGDPILLVDVVYAVCKPEADARGVSDEDFGRAMAGDAIESATEGLMGELVDFFPSARDRARLKVILTKFAALVDRANDLLDAKAAALDMAKAAAMLEAQLGALSGSVPESSESTPAP